MSDERERSYWDRHAKNYDRSMVLLGGPIPRMVALVGDAVVGCENVLEVAAGTGLVTPTIASRAKHVVATDYASTMVELLNDMVRRDNLKNVSCEQADIYALRFEAASFDAVVAANVLHLVPDLNAALRSLQRVLKPGGRIIVPTYCHDETMLSWTVSRLIALTGFPGHRRFTARTLRGHLEAAGIHIQQAETLPGVIPIGFVSGTFAG